MCEPTVSVAIGGCDTDLTRINHGGTHISFRIGVLRSHITLSHAMYRMRIDHCVRHAHMDVL